MPQVTVEEIIAAAQLVESELQAQSNRLVDARPRDEDEAIYLEDLRAGYAQAAVYVNRLWTHQQKRLAKLAHVAAGTSNAPDEHGIAQGDVEAVRGFVAAYSNDEEDDGN